MSLPHGYYRVQKEKKIFFLPDKWKKSSLHTHVDLVLRIKLLLQNIFLACKHVQHLCPLRTKIADALVIWQAVNFVKSTHLHLC